ncbi:cell division protein ZapE [Pseudomonas sp. Marseille-QA0892]
MTHALLDHYHSAIANGTIVSDASQAAAVQILHDCRTALRSGTPSGGVYLWGPVGRGKTWLMDAFHQSLDVPARREHFHHFMQWVHRELFVLTGTADPLKTLAQRLAKEARVLCFDELQVTDIGDAMLLGRLFQALFEQGLVLVSTSNLPPDGLYEDGFNRDRFLPAIEAIKANTQVVALDCGNDYRLIPGHGHQRYWADNDAEGFLAALQQFGALEPPATLGVGRRDLRLQGKAGRAVWFAFAELCQAPRSATDYIELCEHFCALFVSEVPVLGGEVRETRIARGTEDAPQRVPAGDRALPSMARHDDSVRRFIALVDECYDRRVPLFVQACTPIEGLYENGHPRIVLLA